MTEFLIAFLAGCVFGLIAIYVGVLSERRRRAERDQFAQVYTDNHEHPDIFHDLEPLEREQTAPETLVLEVLSDNKDTPVTYKHLTALIEPLNENDIKVAIKSLESKGKVEVSSAGNLGNYYEVQEISEVSDE